MSLALVEMRTKKPTNGHRPTAEFSLDFTTVFRGGMTDDEFLEFCLRNDFWRIEMTKEGDVIIMPPTTSETGRKNFSLTGAVAAWAFQNKTGVGFDSSAGFTLPNSAKRSPDVSWIRRERWDALTDEEKNKFAPICPDFVAEIRSKTDSLKTLQAKMLEYIENGARLGWLIDPTKRKVYVYRPHEKTKILDNPEKISGEPVLPGFELNLQEIW